MQQYDENTLEHFGVMGMRWGVSNDNKQSSTYVKTANLSKFGLGHPLYVAGISGSGKSTVALDIAKQTGSEVIHLDSYFDTHAVGNNKKLNSILKKQGVDKSQMYTKDGQLSYKVSDKILPAIKELASKNLVVVEGVQLLDNTMSNKEYRQGEPIVTMQTSVRKSVNRAMDRDMMNSAHTKTFIKNSYDRLETQKALERSLGVTVGRLYTETLLRNGE